MIRTSCYFDRNKCCVLIHCIGVRIFFLGEHGPKKFAFWYLSYYLARHHKCSLCWWVNFFFLGGGGGGDMPPARFLHCCHQEGKKECVEPLIKDTFETSCFVLCREVVLFFRDDSL